jgi:UDP-N-acetylmuramate dehydrogenase
MSFLRAIARTIAGLTFLFSGFVKLVDPVGVGLIVGEYFKIAGVEDMHRLALFAGSFMAGAEMLVGIAILVGLRMRFAIKVLLAFVSFFTILTLMLALFNPIQDCGCFGEVIKLTNWETFYKNILLLVIALFLFFQRRRFVPIAPRMWEIGFLGVYAALVAFIGIYSIRHLPLVDFTAFHTGTDIPEELARIGNPSGPAFVTQLTYEKSGKREVFTLDNLPDSTWTFIDSKSVPAGKSLLNTFTDFAVSDKDGNYVTDSILSADKLFITTIPYLYRFNETHYRMVSGIHDSVVAAGAGHIVLCGSSPALVDSLMNRYGLDCEVYFTDFKTLITMNRSNGGTMLMNKGVVTAKWSRSDFEKIIASQGGDGVEKILKEDAELIAAERRIREHLLAEITAFAILVLIALMRYVCKFAYTHRIIPEKSLEEEQTLIGRDIIKENLKDIRCKVEWKKDMKRLNTLGLKIFCDWYARPANEEELKELLLSGDFSTMKKLITGSGSNLLFGGDFQGLIIHPDMKDIRIFREDKKYVYLRVGAGVEWDSLVEYATDRGWGGLENLSLIPGCVGASPVQNIGAYGAEAKDTIESVEFLELEGGEKRILQASECDFGYRDSIFKKELKGKVVITYVTFRLTKVPVVNIDYADVMAALSALPSPSVGDVRKAVIDIRKSKLPDPEVVGNAGSFFKNPVVPLELAKSIQSDNPSMKIYPVDEFSCKVPAAWLIEQCGFKGTRKGNVGVHDKQALVLLAYDGAKGSELITLSAEIRTAVKEKFGIDIEPEVNIL